jgi:hypothetical protein
MTVTRLGVVAERPLADVVAASAGARAAAGLRAAAADVPRVGLADPTYVTIDAVSGEPLSTASSFAAALAAEAALPGSRVVPAGSAA